MSDQVPNNSDESSQDEAPTTPEPADSSPESMAADALKAAEAAIAGLNAEADSAASGAAPDSSAKPFTYESLKNEAAEPPASNESLTLISDVNLNVKIELGRTRMMVDDVLKLAEGSVVELDKLAGDPVDVFVNDRHVARGEVLVLNDNFCVRINEILVPGGAAANMLKKR